VVVVLPPLLPRADDRLPEPLPLRDDLGGDFSVGGGKRGSAGSSDLISDITAQRSSDVLFRLRAGSCEVRLRSRVTVSACPIHPTLCFATQSWRQTKEQEVRD
jgi:hypothetical protein